MGLIDDPVPEGPVPVAKDRLTQPLLRKKNGQFAKDGDFDPVSWDEAFDIMAAKWKEAIAKDLKDNAGKPVDQLTSRVAMFGSGQWAVWEGYAASKLMKGGLRSNNLDPNARARHCMASAVVAFIRAFVLWGANMAEMYPILWSRLTDTRLTKPGREVHVLSTFENRCFELADNPVVFTPQTDLVILNYIANYIIRNKAYGQAFIDRHVNFTKTPADIGYGLRLEHPLERKAANAGKGKLIKIGFEEYAKSVAPYTLDKAHEMSGVSKERLERLAKLYADPTP